MPFSQLPLENSLDGPKRSRTLLIPKDSPLSFVLLEDHRWQRVFQGDIEDVFVKKADKPALAPGAMGAGAKVE